MSMKIKYEKSLANIYPEIALEWHPTRNGELTPYGVSAKLLSGKLNDALSVRLFHADFGS